MVDTNERSIERAIKWAKDDPNDITSSIVKNLVEKTRTSTSEQEKEEASSKLMDLFPSDGSRIGFGTAGLRSKMDVGPHGMNDLVVIQTAQGLARYCQEEAMKSVLPNSTNKLLAVIGYDHRSNPEMSLSSQSFGLLTKLVFLEAGFDCILLDGYVPTPIVAFATTRLKASVGIMITASHNPKEDAGYKVYWHDGCQIRPPLDSGIANKIEENLTPWINYAGKLESTRIECGASANDACYGLSDPAVTDSIANDYFDAIAQSGLVTGQGQPNNNSDDNQPVIVAYTAMHGVGHRWAIRSFETFGLPPFLSVPEQQEPDYNFPSVSFPNPEEKGALAKAMDYSCENGADVILANDPDADRLAVAEKCRTTGTWTTFTGDQIGTMLGHWIWEMIGKSSDKPVAMCSSTVSSQMLGVIGETEGFYFEDTLTGFKWIGSRSMELGKEGYKSLFSYEEAIGFCCGDVISDKDGLSAMGVMAELATHVYRNGKNLVSHMESLYLKYGEFVSNNGYFYCYEPETILRIMDEMRKGGSYMTHVGEYEIESIRDLGYPGYDSSTKNKKPTLPVSKSSPMITMRFKNGCVAQFRASGTEPKFKYYIEMRGKPGIPRCEVAKSLEKMTEILLEDLLKPSSNDLIKP